MKAALAPLVLGLAACLVPAAQGDSGPLRVVTLGTVLAEIARGVGGSEATVVNLVEPGVDPHTFNPSPADVRTLVDWRGALAAGAALGIIVGLLARRRRD